MRFVVTSRSALAPTGCSGRSATRRRARRRPSRNLSLLPAAPIPAPRPTVRRPFDLRVHAQRIQIDELIVTDPRQVLAHTRTAAHAAPDTAALLGYSTTTPLTLPAAVALLCALLCALHDADELADTGLHMVRHTTRVTAATQHRDPVVLELSDAPEQDH
ncbi:hypothetical protein ACIOML_23470 [Streptomyces anulatus]